MACGWEVISGMKLEGSVNTVHTSSAVDGSRVSRVSGQARRPEGGWAMG